MLRAPPEPLRLLLLSLAVGIALWPGGPLPGGGSLARAQALPGPPASEVANVTATTVRQECVSYNADVSSAVRSSDGSAVMSAVLVPDTVSAVVGAVDVRNVALTHSRLGALMVTLHWLPYADKMEDINPRELEEIANATSILKDIRQGGSGANINSVSFSDAANATIAMEPVSNLSGTYKPTTPLSIFTETRLPSRGRWVLLAEDVGSGHKNRSVTLSSWSLVVCPGMNESLPLSLREQMAQQAMGAFDLSAARAGRPFSAAVRQAASGPFGARAGSQPLAAAIGTLVTRDATIEYKSYSTLADNAVDAAIRFENNVQSLFGLPYEPNPVIDQVLPWVEILIGGTDFTIQNAVWPGKIVFYALQLEVFVRMREAMAASGGGGSGGSGSGSGGSGSGSGGSGSGSGGSGSGSGSGGNGGNSSCGTGNGGGSSGSGGAGGGGSGGGSAGGGGGSGSGSGSGGGGGSGSGSGSGGGSGSGSGGGSGGGGSGGASGGGGSGSGSGSGSGGGSGNGGGGGNGGSGSGSGSGGTGGGGGGGTCGTGSGSGGGGNGGGNGGRREQLRDNSDKTPNCGMVDGPDGPVMVNKKLLQRDLCRVMMPLEYAEYTMEGGMSPLPARSSPSGGSSTAGGGQQQGQPWRESEDAADENGEPGGEADGVVASGGSRSSPWDRGLGRLLSGSSSLRFPTPLAPLDFRPAPLLGGVGGGGLRAPLELQNALLEGTGLGLGQGLLGRPQQAQGQDDDSDEYDEEEEASSGPARPFLQSRPMTSSGTQQQEDGLPGAVRPDPEAVNRIIENAFSTMDMADFNSAMLNELEGAIIRAERVSSVLGATANSADLFRQGGNQAVQTAQSLQASADTYTEVLRAGRDSIQRFNDEQLKNWTREWLKDGGFKKEMDGMNKAGRQRKGQVNRFVFLFQRVRLTFRFSATDGFQLTYIQWLYNWADVNNIIGLANTLQTLDNSQKKNNTGKNNNNNNNNNNGNKNNGNNKGNRRFRDGLGDDDGGSPSDDASGAGAGGRIRGILPTGETPGAWFKRVRDEANDLAKRALSRIPIDHTIGINRRAYATGGSQMGGG